MIDTNTNTHTHIYTYIHTHTHTYTPPHPAVVLVPRLQERRRSSVVVSIPGLDVSPGDLFVSNGSADRLNGSALSGNSGANPV